jgi:hypothetical protein
MWFYSGVIPAGTAKQQTVLAIKREPKALLKQYFDLSTFIDFRWHPLHPYQGCAGGNDA